MNERVQAIYTAIEFIESRLQEDITVADIAAAAGYSLYHFIRTFNQTVQHTPYDYLMRRRLSQAAIALLESDRRVINIALDFQFNNPETFTRAFRRIFEMAPTRWREQGFADQRYLMSALDLDYLEYLTSPDFALPRLVALEQEVILTGLMGPLTADSEAIPALWLEIRRALHVQSKNPGLHDFWGIRIQPQIPGGTLFYLAALKIPSLEFAPAAFVTKIIPAGDYICLSQGKNMPDTRPDDKIALLYLYHTFMPKAGLIPAEPLEIEHFGEWGEVLIPVRRLQKGGEFLS